jgi:hypothetical protein
MTRPAPSRGAVLLLLALPVVGAAQELPSPENYHLRAEYWKWWPNLTSQIQKGFSTTPGTLLDVKNDLGVTDKSTWEVRGAIKFSPGFKLRGDYTAFDYAGSTNAATNFSFGQNLYRAGTHVNTTIKGGYYTGALEWDFVKSRQGFLGAFIGAKYLTVDAVIVAPSTGQRDLESASIPAPILGLAGRIYQGHFSLEGEFSGFTIGDRGHLWELEVTARLHLSDHLAVSGGYRRFSVEGRNSRDYVNFEMSGWTIGGELSL